MKDRKILYVITKSNWGGSQRYVFDLASAMKERGYRVSVALGGKGALKEKLDIAGITTHTIEEMERDVSLLKDWKTFQKLYRIMKAERPDIVHLNSPKAAGLGSLAARIIGVRQIVQTVHGFTFNEDRPRLQKALIKFFTWLSMLFCHKTLVLSKREFKQALRFFFVKNKVEFLTLGISEKKGLSPILAKAKIAELTTFPIDKKPTIGTIAELHKNKGLEYLIMAMPKIVEKIPDIKLIIIGSGEEKRNLLDLIKALNLENVVTLGGYIENASDYVQAFDVFVLSSIKEGLPYVILEAGLAGVPIVATSVGGISEIVENGNSGSIVPPKNSDALARAITELMLDQETRKDFSLRLKQKIETAYSAQAMISKLADLYK